MHETPDQLSDEELMTMYQSGEAAAFELLYQRHSARVLGYLEKRSNAQSARELMQETFLKLHRSRELYSAEYPFLPWLFTIARNVLFDFLRLKETKVALGSFSEPDPQVEAGAEEAEEAMGASDIAGALASLPETQRRAIELRYLKDWSFEQIAGELATTQPNVRQLVSRGLKRLRVRWGREKA